MIKIKSLYKVYRSKNLKKCYALNDVNLTLPDTGLVFVLGKSGSGKSTLLNLIGGLDKITSGTIEVDGNDISHLNERRMCNYRNSHIGFIFQDYHLIDELTVYDNIVLSLNLRRMKDYQDVSMALAKVGLSGYESRYPSELSGGERQRVAIARAIIKEPRIILADEPTGNLDPQTANSIISLLHELSRECLILVVSHNTRDARAYADRIIELSDGFVRDDYTRQEGEVGGVRPSGNVMIYPEGRELTDHDISVLNDNLSRPIVKSKSQFAATQESDDEPTFVEIAKEKLGFFKKMRLSNKFLKRKTFAIALSSFMVAVIMVIMSLAQTIIAFDSSAIISDELTKHDQDSMLLNKVLSNERIQELGRNYRVAVDEGDIQALYDAGYSGKIYPVLSATVSVSSRAIRHSLANALLSGSPYLPEALGTIVVDDAFLEEQFGTVIYAARLDEFRPYGVVITDYIADAILLINNNYKNKTYDALLGKYHEQGYTRARAYINGIINTGYKERYADLFDTFNNKTSINMADFADNKDFQSFASEVYQSLGYCYATDPNFAQSYSNSLMTVDEVTHYLLNFNGVFNYNATVYPTVLNYYYQTNPDDYEYMLTNPFMYTTELPVIPEGAKYIRVTFNDIVDSGSYKVDHEVAKMDCALLRFDDGEPVAKELMNYLRPAANLPSGWGIDPLDGSIISTGGYGPAGVWISDYIEIPEGAEITEFACIAYRLYAFYAFYDENKQFISAKPADGDPMPDDCIVMNYERYNETFGTNYNSANFDTFIPHTVVLSQYDYDDVEHKEPLFTKEVTIIALHDSSSRTLYAGQNVFDLFAKDSLREIGLYLDGADGIGNILDVVGELNYQPQSFAVEGIHTMTKAVDVFVPIFELIAIVLCVGVVFILFNFSSRMIKDKMHEIGILKALGTQNGTVATVFGLQVVLIAIFTCILSTVGYYYFIDLANDVLIESLKSLTERVVLDLDFLIFQKDIARNNCILICVLAIVALIPSMIKVKVIKPVKIIKTKD